MRRLWLDGCWSMHEKYGPETPSIFMGPGPKPWAVLAGGPGAFSMASERLLSLRFVHLVVRLSWGGVGGSGPC